MEKYTLYMINPGIPNLDKIMKDYFDNNHGRIMGGLYETRIQYTYSYIYLKDISHYVEKLPCDAKCEITVLDTHYGIILKDYLKYKCKMYAIPVVENDALISIDVLPIPVIVE